MANQHIEGRLSVSGILTVDDTSTFRSSLQIIENLQLNGSAFCFGSVTTEGPIKAQKLEIGEEIRAGALTIGPWPAGPATAPEHTVQIGDGTQNVSLSMRGKDLQTSSSFLAFEDNMGTSKQWFRIVHNSDSNVLNIRSKEVNPIMSFVRRNGRVGIGTAKPEHRLHIKGEAKTRGITFSADDKWWHRKNGEAAIVNDAHNYKALMIVGADYGRGHKRWVRVWDTLSVHGVKQFMIDHPLDRENKFLVHAAIEGPEAAVYYRGEAELINGTAIVQLPPYFEALTSKEGRTVQITSKIQPDEPASILGASAVQDGQFQVHVLNGVNPSQQFFWEVKAVRADVEPLVIEEPKEVFGDTLAPASHQLFASNASPVHKP